MLLRTRHLLARAPCQQVSKSYYKWELLARGQSNAALPSHDLHRDTPSIPSHPLLVRLYSSSRVSALTAEVERARRALSGTKMDTTYWTWLYIRTPQRRARGPLAAGRRVMLVRRKMLSANQSAPAYTQRGSSRVGPLFLMQIRDFCTRGFLKDG